MSVTPDFEHEFSYVPQLGRTLGFLALMFSLAGICSWIILDGGPPLFFGVSAFGLALASLLGFPDLVNSIGRRGRVALATEGAFVANRPWKRGEAFFTYDSVKDLQMVRSGRSVRLMIIRDGSDYLIAAERFESSAHFADFYELLMKKCGFDLTHEQNASDAA